MASPVVQHSGRGSSHASETGRSAVRGLRRRRIIAAALIGVAGINGSVVSGADVTYDAGGTPNSNWNVNENWVGDAKPTVGDAVILDSSAIPILPRAMTLDADFTLQSVSLSGNTVQLFADSSNSASRTLTLTGNGSPSPTLLNVSSGVLALQGSSPSYQNNGTATTFTPVSLNVALGASGVINVDGPALPSLVPGGALSIASTISNVGAGNFTLTKTGSGLLFLGATNNTFGGGAGQAVTISNGTLGIIADGGLGAASNTVAMGNGANLGLFENISLNRTISVAAGATASIEVNRYQTAGYVGGAITAGDATSRLLRTGTGSNTSGIFAIVAPLNFAGVIELGQNSGTTLIRASSGNSSATAGSINGAAGLIINSGATLTIDNQNAFAGFVGSATNTALANNNRVADNIPITLNGGFIRYIGTTLTTGTNPQREQLGTSGGAAVTLALGMSSFDAQSSGGNGGELYIDNLVRLTGATANLTGNGTLGTAGAQGRIYFANGTAAPANQTIIPWATINNTEFAGYTTANGVILPTNAAFTANTSSGTFSGTGTTNLRYTGTVAGAVTSGGMALNSLNMQVTSGGLDITFANASDTLTLNSGGLLFSNATHAVGTTTTRGQLTSGAAELFVHTAGSTVTINSVITGSNALVKDGPGGTLSLTAGNTYSGGTFINGGTLTTGSTATTTYLGSGAVSVSNAQLNLNVSGATTSTGGYTAVNNGYINLANVAYSATGDRFNIATGSIIGGGSATGTGLNSLTLVSSPAGLTTAGTVYLAPEAIVLHNLVGTTANGSGANTIQGLGTTPLYYFGVSGTNTAGQGVTVGAGTPWKGISSSRTSTSFDRGTITANSDFVLQGLVVGTGNNNTTNTPNVLGTQATLTIGGNTAVTVNNTTAGSIRVFTEGNVSFNSGTPTLAQSGSIPSTMSFVVTPSSTLIAGANNAFGLSTTNASLNPIITVRAGGALDYNNTIGSGINTNVFIEPGGRFVANDLTAAAGSVGGLNGIGTISFAKGAVLDIAFDFSYIPKNVNAITGTQPLSFAPGAIIRLENQASQPAVLSASPVGVSTRLPQDGFYELLGNGMLTQQLTKGDNTPTPAENITLNGGVITNDANSRVLLGGYGGRILFGANGGTFAGTVAQPQNVAISGQTFLQKIPIASLQIQDDFELTAGQTLNIGTTEQIAGNTKVGTGFVLTGGVPSDVGTFGAVSLTALGGNQGTATSTINVTPGAQLQLSAANVLPDQSRLNLQANSALFLNVTPVDTIGELTGSGVIIGNQATTTTAGVQAGASNTSFTFDGILSNLGGLGSNPALYKIGTGTMTLTSAAGASNSTAILGSNQGIIRLAPTASFQSVAQANKGAQFTIDGGGTGTHIRQLQLGGGGSSPGQFNLLNNTAGAITETISQINVNAPGGGILNIDANATLLATTLQGSNNVNGQSVLTLRGPNIGTGPANGTTAAFIATAPNLRGSSTTVNTAQPATAGGAGTVGTPFVAIRPDVLIENGSNVSFTTQDVSTATAGLTVGFRALAASEYQNFLNPGTISLTAGQDNASVKLGAVTVNTNYDTRANSLTLSGSTINVNAPGNSTFGRLLLISGGIIATNGTTNTIQGSAFLDRSGNQPFYFHTIGDLNVNSLVNANQGMVKTGTGSLNFGAGSLQYLQTNGGFITINDGTVTLGSSNNTFVLNGTGGSTFSGTNINLNGGTLNLNGNSQTLEVLQSSNPLPIAGAAGGSLTNTSATAANVMVRNNSTFSGTIDGNINLSKAGGQTLVLTNGNSYSGTTTLRGGTLQLRDQGTLASTQYYNTMGSMLLDSTALNSVSNRIPSGSNVNIYGGTIDLRGAAGQAVTQTINTLNAGSFSPTSPNTVGTVGGHIILNVNAGSAGSTDLQIGTLNRQALTTIAFTSNNSYLGSNSGGFGSNNGLTSPRILITNLSNSGGAAASPASQLSQNILGAWAVATSLINGQVSADWATYDANRGVGNLNPMVGSAGATAAVATGATSANFASPFGYASYSANTITTATTANDNVYINNPNGITLASLSGGVTINSLKVGFNTTFNNTTDVLTIKSGGIIFNGNSTLGNTTAAKLQSGTSEMYIYSYVNTNSLNMPIQDNGSTSLSVIKSGPNTLNFQGANIYTGTTYVNQGTLALNVGSANRSTIVAIPGDLVIIGQQGSNSTVSLSQANQIKDNVNLTMVGSAQMTMSTGASDQETFNNITFSTVAGNTTPTLTTNTSTLKVTNGITATNDNIGSNAPTMAGSGFLDFISNATQKTITVGGSAPVGLIITNQINNANLVKAGSGLLALNPATNNTYSALNINEGALRADTVGALGASAVTTNVNAGGTLLYNATGFQTSTATATITVTPVTGSIALAGGTIGSVGGTTPEIGGTLTVSAASTIQSADFYSPTVGRTLQVFGKLTGNGGLTINGPINGGNTGTVQLINPTNDYSGTYTLNANAILNNQVLNYSGSTSAAPLVTGTNPTIFTGSALGANSSIVLQGGQLFIRDDSATPATAGSTIGYFSGNSITVNAPSIAGTPSVISIDRSNFQTTNSGTLVATTISSTAATGNIVTFGSLTFGGDGTLRLAAGNSYKYTFGAVTVNGTGGATLTQDPGVTINSTGAIGLNNKLTVDGDGTSTLGAITANNASGVLNRAGYGQTVLSAATTANGSNPVLQVTSGLLRVSAVAQLPSPANVSVAGGVLQIDPTGTSTVSTYNAANLALSNGGTLQARSGASLTTANIAGSTTPTFVAGLRQGRLNATTSYTDPNNAQNSATDFSQINRQYANSGSTGGLLIDNSTAVFTGQFYVADSGNGTGKVAFGAMFDDASNFRLDGKTVLAQSGASNAVGTGAMTLAAGWHHIDVRFSQTSGGTGVSNIDPVNHWGVTQNGLAFGIDPQAKLFLASGKPDGNNYVNPADAGTMNLFRTASGGGNVNVEAAVTLKAPQLTNIADVNLNGNGATTTAAVLQLTGAGLASDAVSVTLTQATSATAFGTIDVGGGGGNASTSLTTQYLNSGGGTLTKTGAGTLTVTMGQNLYGTVAVAQGALVLNGSAAPLVVDKNLTGGTSTTLITASLAITSVGNATGNAGSISGTGTLAGPLTVLATGTAGPGSNAAAAGSGNGTGIFKILLPSVTTSTAAPTALTMTGSTARLQFEIAGTVPGTGYDQIKINGLTAANAVNLGTSTLELLLTPGSYNPGDQFVLIDNNTTGTTTGTFTSVANGSISGNTITLGTEQFNIIYNGNAAGDATNSNNDVILTAVTPEPGSIALLGLGAIGLLARRRRRR